MKLPIPLQSVLSTKATGYEDEPTFAQSTLLNCVVETDDTGTPYATRRLGFQTPSAVYDGASATSETTKNGFGIYWWDSQLFMAVGTGLYEDLTSSKIATVGAYGLGNRLHFAEDGTYLLMLNADMNDGWYLEATTHTVTSIAALPASLGAGIVVLGGYAFVCSGTAIYNSDLNDSTAGYSDFISAEREPDEIVIIVKHKDGIAAFGKKTIEFYYNNGNATGSPLLRREDVFYNIGVVNELGVKEIGDVTVFCGVDPEGVIGIYVLDSYQLRKISNDDQDAWMSYQARVNGAYPTVTPISYRGRLMVQVHPGSVGASRRGFIIDGEKSYVWSKPNSRSFQLIDSFSDQTSGGSSVQYYQDGETGTVYKLGYRETAYAFWDRVVYATGYQAVTQLIVFPTVGLDRARWLFARGARAVMRFFETGLAATLKWRKEGDSAFSTGRSLTVAGKFRTTNIGRFQQIDFSLESSDTSTTTPVQMECYGLDVDIVQGRA